MNTWARTGPSMSPRREAGDLRRTYLRGMSPGYWFTVDPEELIRHRIPGQPHIPVWLAPPILLGVVGCLWRGRRSAAHRLVLVAVFAAPFSSRVSRSPGPRRCRSRDAARHHRLDTLQQWAGRWAPAPAFGAAVGIGLVSAGALMTVRAVRDGGTWYDEYGLYGMQWGASQVFGRILEQHGKRSHERFVISYSWANNPGSFGDFFLTPAEREHIRWTAVEDLLRKESSRSPLEDLRAHARGLSRAVASCRSSTSEGAA